MSQLLNIAIIGDFDREKPSHLATNASIEHAARYLGLTVNIRWLPTPLLEEQEGRRMLEQSDGIWAGSGSPYQSPEGALIGIRAARELPPVEARALQVAELAYRGNQLPADLLEQMVELSTEIERAFSTFRAEMDGKRLSNNDLLEMLRKEIGESLVWIDAERPLDQVRLLVRRAIWEAS